MQPHPQERNNTNEQQKDLEMQRKQEPMPEPNDESFDKTKKVKPLIAKAEPSQELQETEKEE